MEIAEFDNDVKVTQTMKALKAWRKHHGYTQEAAAARLQVPLRTLQNWEIGRNEPAGFAKNSLLEKLTPRTTKRKGR